MGLQNQTIQDLVKREYVAYLDTTKINILGLNLHYMMMKEWKLDHLARMIVRVAKVMKEFLNM